MFAYLNELVYSKEDDEHKKRRIFSINKLEGEGGIIEAGYPFLTTEGGAEPTKFRAKHTYLPVNLDEFFPAAGGVGAGVKPAKLRLPLAKAISKLARAMNEASSVNIPHKSIKESTRDRTDTEEKPLKKIDTLIIALDSIRYRNTDCKYGADYKWAKHGDTLLHYEGQGNFWINKNSEQGI